MPFTLPYDTHHRSFRVGKHHDEALRLFTEKHGFRNDSAALRSVLDMVAETVGVAIPEKGAADVQKEG